MAKIDHPKAPLFLPLTVNNITICLKVKQSSSTQP
jgi:hypothetical protein